MAARIARHRAERPRDWLTVEAVRDLAAAVQGAPDQTGNRTVLLDGVGGLVSERLLVGGDAAGAEESACAEVAALQRACTRLIAVSDEVGSGLVSPHPLGRGFQDALGRVNQRLAARAGRVLLCVAGLPFDLKTP